MIVLYILAALIAGCSALYSPESNVIDLNPDNFDSEVIQSDDIWIVQFYSPMNVRCMQLVPEYTKAAKLLLGLAKVGAVNADKHTSLETIYNVGSVPNILIFGANKHKPEEYQGVRTSQGIVDAALDAKVTARLERKYAESSSSTNTTTNDSFSTTEIVFIVIGSIILFIVVCLAIGGVGVLVMLSKINLR